MKRLVLVAAVLALAACTSKKDEAATADTSAPAMAPAPAALDTSTKLDTTARTTRAATTTTKKTTTKTSQALPPRQVRGHPKGASPTPATSPACSSRTP